MDNPSLTFALLDEITTSETYNGLIPFTNVAEAATSLKKQIADLVGQSLTKVFSPMRAEIKDVLAEIKTLRQELGGAQKHDPRFLQIIRYIIDENRSKGFKYLIEHTIGPIDKAVPLIIEAESFDDFIKKSGWALVMRDVGAILLSPEIAHDIFGAMSFGVPSLDNPLGSERADFLIKKNRTIEMNPAAHSHFDWDYHELKMQIGK